MNLFIEEEWVDKNRDCRSGGSGVYETCTDNVGVLFNSLQKEHGRCKSGMFIDVKGSAEPKKIGWVFEKTSKYSDTGEPFLVETWVTVHEDLPEKTIRYFYKDL